MYCAKRTCDATEPHRRISRRTIADVCVMAVFMSAKLQLPGPRAFRQSRALGKHLIGLNSTFPSLTAFVRDNKELARIARVYRTIDVCPQFVGVIAQRNPREVNGERMLHSFYSVKEIKSFFRQLPSGSVCVCLGTTCIDTFLIHADSFDCISNTENNVWNVKTKCSGDVLCCFRERSEIIILENIM